MNSRGLSSLRYYCVFILMASVKTRIGNPHCTFASLQTPYLYLVIIPRVWKPAAIRPSGLASSRRLWVVSSEQWVMSFEQWAMRENTSEKTGTWIAGGFQALGFLWLHNNGVCKDAERQPSLHVRVFADAISLSCHYSTGLKTRGYSPFGLRVLTDAFE